MENIDEEDVEKRPRKEVLMEELESLKVIVPDLFKQTINNEEVEFSWKQLTISYKYLVDKISYSMRTTERKQIDTLFKNSLQIVMWQNLKFHQSQNISMT